MSWSWVPLAYFTYLAAVAVIRLRWPRVAVAPGVALGCWSAALARRAGILASLPPVVEELVVPGLLLLLGYWMSGLFLVRPSLAAERWFQHSDRDTLERTGVLAAYRRAPRIVQEFFEFSYLLVYAVIPVGAGVLLLAATRADAERFWTVVLLAEFASYGVIPWLQTRPPRVLDPAPHGSPVPLFRRLNLAIVGTASIHANTIPSGHAAGAFACAFGVMSALPFAGAGFLAAAICIAAGAVLGRYHFLFDALSGIVVALAALGWVVYR